MSWDVSAADAVDRIRLRVAWDEYAAERFTPGSDKAKAMLQLLKSRVQSALDRLRVESHKQDVQLDFTHARLALLVIEQLDRPCDYCGGILAVADFGIVQDLPHGVRVGHPGGFGLANLRVCCGACAHAKGWLSGSEWRDVRAALRGADVGASREALAALALGYKQRDRSRSAKVLPEGCAAPVTHEAGWCARKQREK
jgi:hypothetical protein